MTTDDFRELRQKLETDLAQIYIERAQIVAAGKVCSSKSMERICHLLRALNELNDAWRMVGGK